MRRPAAHALLLSIAMALAGAPVGAQDAPNLVANGDFSQGLQGWWVPPVDTCKAAIVPTDVEGVKQALKVAVSPKPGADPWSISMGRQLEAALKKGTVVRARLWVRSPQSCRVSVLVQLARDPWSTIIGRTVTAGTKWREVVIQGRCTSDYPVGDANLSLQLAHGAGEIEIADLRVADLGPDAPEAVPSGPANPLGLIPFVLPWDDASPGVTNAGSWLEKPAGARGFVAAREGHLFAGDRRLRLLGTNICTSACFPEHADADKVSARLARFGINCVRFHHMDAPFANNIIFGPDKRAIDPQQLERLDYFISRLKANGIYTNLNLHVSRVYPGCPTWDGMPEFFKGVDLFYPPMVQMQRDYARDLLTHVNPYTKTRYADEPSVAIVEINNENGLISQWSWGSLDAMPQVYRDELQRRWNAWLKARYADGAALKKAWDLVARPLGAEMLANGDFRRGLDGWVLEQNGTARATAAAAAGGPGGKASLAVSVDAIDDQGWHVQLLYPGLKLEKGGVYTLEFDARSEGERTVGVDLRQAHEPWGTLWSLDVKLAPEWKHFRLPVSVSDTEENGRVTISNLGARTGRVEFAGVSLRPGGGFQLPAGAALGSIAPIAKAEYGGLNAAMQRDWSRFLWDTEMAYWTAMAKYLREELGVKCPIVGTAAGFSPVGIQSTLDVVDAHAYWKHPHFPGRPWDGDNWVLPNVPMAGVSGGGELPNLALNRVAGKPFLVTEYNHPAPNTHNSEAFLLAAAYAGLQDWDGFFSFAYEGSRESWSANRILSYFDVEHHPTQMATMPAAAALFLRGDLEPPKRRETEATTLDGWADVVRQKGNWANAGSLGIGRTSALQHPVALRFDGGAPEKQPPPAGGARIASDDGGWVWDSTQGRERVLVDTARSKALIGCTAGGPVALGGVTLAPGKNLQEWAAITLTAIDGPGFGSAGRILVTATGYAENTSMGWRNEEKNTVGTDWGTGPTLVEGIPAEITLPVAARRVSVWALDERGQRRSPVPVRDAAGKALFEIGPAHKTVWYEVEVR